MSESVKKEKNVSAEQFLEHIIKVMQTAFKDDARFAGYLNDNPQVRVSYKNRKLVIDAVEWTVDGGWDKLVATEDEIFYKQEKCVQTLISYRNWGFFKIHPIQE